MVCASLAAQTGPDGGDEELCPLVSRRIDCVADRPFAVNQLEYVSGWYNLIESPSVRRPDVHVLDEANCVASSAEEFDYR